MIRPVILIMSCKRDVENGSNEACRQTWLKEWPNQIDYKFVIGNECLKSADDELLVKSLDDYWHLSDKVNAAFQWAVEQGYTHTFKCDTDTYIHIPRLLESNFDKAEYIGRRADTASMYASGGSGYWLSNLAVEKLLAYGSYRWHWAEDLNTGAALQSNKIFLTPDDRYTEYMTHFLDCDGITFYVSRDKDNSSWPELIRVHKKITGRPA